MLGHGSWSDRTRHCFKQTRHCRGGGRSRWALLSCFNSSALYTLCCLENRPWCVQKEGSGFCIRNTLAACRFLSSCLCLRILAARNSWALGQLFTEGFSGDTETDIYVSILCKKERKVDDLGGPCSPRGPRLSQSPDAQPRPSRERKSREVDTEGGDPALRTTAQPSCTCKTNWSVQGPFTRRQCLQMLPGGQEQGTRGPLRKDSQPQR